MSEPGGGEPDCLEQGDAAVCAVLVDDVVEVTASGLQPGTDLVVVPDGFDEPLEQVVSPGGHLAEPMYVGGPTPGGSPPSSYVVSGTAADGSPIEGTLHPTA